MPANRIMVEDGQDSRAHGPGDRRAFGLRFCSDSREELISAILAKNDPAEAARIVVTANLDHIVTLRSDAAFRLAYAGAWKVTADGMPVYFYARARGAGVRERITGSDLTAELVHRWRPGIDRLFMLVSNPTTGVKIRSLLRRRGFSSDAINIEVPPFGFESDQSYSDALAAKIAGFRTTHLVMGVGAPKSEIWAARYAKVLGGTVVLCVGASIEFITGEKRRAPKFIQRFGFEWLWRVACEPQRLFHRYFIRSWGFVLAVADDLST